MTTRVMVLAVSFALAAAVAAACGDSTSATPSDPADQTAIAFSYQTSQFGRGMSIYLMAADKSGLRQIANDSLFDVAPAWSPDGRTLLFTRYGPGVPNALWVMNPDGSGVRKLSSGPDAIGYGRWSPDGQSIVYLAPTLNLGIMRADGSNAHLVAPSLVTEVRGAPSWSKTGRIAFVRSQPQFPGIWTVRPDGTELTQLTSHPGDAQPSWSPDGTRLLYESYGASPTNSYSIVVMNADGTGRRQLTDGPDQSAAWSPDGKKILFDRHVPYGYESSCPLYIVPSDGGEALPLLPERTRAACGGSAWRALPAR